MTKKPEYFQLPKGGKKQHKKARGKKRNRTLLARSKPLSQQHENFARLLFQGATIAHAAEKCGFSFSYARKLAHEPVIKDRKKKLNEEYMADARKVDAEGYQEVRITRNQIINGLADIALNGLGETRARVAAFVALADIFMLRAKSFKDILNGYGWFDEEAIEYSKTGVVPERLRQVLPPDQIAALLGSASVRTNQSQTN
jgi:hypothetical protein